MTNNVDTPETEVFDLLGNGEPETDALTPDEQASETETETVQAEAPKPETVTKEEYERLKAEYEKATGRIGTLKGHLKTVSRVVKHQMDDGLVDDETAQQAAGIDTARLRGIIDAPDMAENPVEAQKQAFHHMYVELGVKDTLDEVYGEDTGKYAVAFGNFAASDPELLAKFEETDKAKLPAFVVKHGKALLERYGDGGLKGYVARLEAKLAALEGQAPEPEEGRPKPKTSMVESNSIVANASAYEGIPDWKRRLINPN